MANKRTPFESTNPVNTPRTVGSAFGKRVKAVKVGKTVKAEAHDEDSSIPTNEPKTAGPMEQKRRKANAHRNRSTALGRGKSSIVETE